MKKRKILLSVLSLVLLVGVIVGVMSMSTSAARGTGGTITQNGENPWLSNGLGLVKGTDYAYSFAVVGDTQNLNYKDIGAGTTNMHTLYQWLVDNKAAMNIQYVMGVGDITQSWTRTYGDKYYAEWVHAAEAVSLLDGKIPYSLVRGNHDFSDAKDGFNGVFGVGDKAAVTDENGNTVVDNQYYENLLALSQTPEKDKDGNIVKDSKGNTKYMAGFRLDGKIEETYRKVTMGDQKYIIFTLDWHPMSKETDCVKNAADLCKDEEYCYVHYSVRSVEETASAKTCDNDSANCKHTTGCKLHNSYVNGTTFCSTTVCTDDCTKHDTLGWLDGLLRENSDYTAIITMHSFIMRDGSFVDDIEDTFPYENVNNSKRPGWHEVATTGGNVSPRQLWDKVLSKHANVKMLFCGHVDEDNIVTTQLRGDNGNTVTCMLVDGQTIDSNVEPVGLVAMYYMSADGNVVDVEYISTVRAAAGKPAYLRAVNQIKDFPLTYSSWTETAYGSIPTDVYNAYTFHVMLDDDSNPATVNTLYGSYNTWEETITRVTELNEVASAASRKAKTYNIIMSKDYTFTNTSINKHNQMCNNPSAVVFDLNGKTFTLASGTTFLPFYNAKNDRYPKFTVKNGNFVMQGTSRLIVTQHGHPKNASGSKIDVNLTDLNITYASGATGSLVHPFSMSEKSETRSTVNLNVTNCNIDASAADNVHIFNLKDKWNDSDVMLNIKGGSIKGSTVAKTTLFLQNWPGDTVTFIPDENGNYTSFTFTDNTQLDGVFYSETDGKYLEYGAPAESNGVYVTNLTSTTKILIDKGYVEPEKYNDIENYPFVVFKDGKAIHYFKLWGKEFINPGGYVYNNATYQSGCTVYLRRDYSTSELAADGSTKNANPWYMCYIDDMTIDLGGNTITRTDDYGLFTFLGRDATKHTANVTIKNGTVMAGTKYSAVYFDNQTGGKSSDNTGMDTVNLTFDNVDFDVSNGQSVIGCSTANMDYGITANIVFNNCDFLRGSRTSTNVLFKLAESSAQNKCDINVTVNGGTIQMKSVSNFHIAYYSTARDGVSGSPDSVIFGKGSNAPKIVLPSTYKVPANPFYLTDGDYYLAKLSENTDNTTNYTLDRIDTPYGNIGVAYASAEKYPFALFYNGSFKSGYETFKDAVSAAVALTDTAAEVAVSDTVYIVMRRDFVSDSAAGIMTTRGNIVVDLLGYQLSSTDGSYLVNSYINYDSITSSNVKTYLEKPSQITFKNGTLKNTRSTYALIAFDMGVGKYEDGTLKDGMLDEAFSAYSRKHLIFAYENISFKTDATPIMHAWDNKVGEGMDIDVILNGCTIDPTGLTSNLAMFSFADNNKVFDANVTLNGCNVTASKLNSYKLYAVGEGDTATLGTYNGGSSYLTVTQTESATPNNIYTTNNGDSVSFALTYSESKKFVYELRGATKKVWSNYPEIPVAHLNDASTYPFVLFYNGEYKEVYTTFSSAVNAAAALVKSDANATVYVVLRKNYESTGSDKFASLADVRGKIVVDLSGYEFNSTATTRMIDLHINYPNANASFKSEIEFKNGTIKNSRTAGNALVTLGHGTTTDYDENATYTRKAYQFTFNNITFKTTENNSIIQTWNHLKPVGIDIIVKADNCTFDFTGAKENTTMFNFANGQNVYANMMLKGCTIVASDLSKYNLWSYSEDNTDTLTIETNENGSYLTVIQSTRGIPTASFTAQDGKTIGWTDGRISNTNDAYVYELRTAVVTEYGTITSTYADAAKYPVAMFYTDKTFIAGYQDLDLAYAKALESANLSKSFVILIRRDMTKNANTTFGGTFKGSILVDMGGHTVTVTENGNYFFDITVNNTGATGASFTVKNGKYVKEKGRGFICINYSATSLSSGATEIGYSFNFDNVTFESGSAHNNNNVIFTTWEDKYSSVNYQVNVTSVFNNCTFDLKNSVSTAQMLNLNYDANGSRDRVVHNVTIKGGTIIADTADDINTNFAVLDGNTNGRADTLKFAANDNGEYVTLLLPTAVSDAITGVWSTVDGLQCKFVKISTENGNNVYKMSDTVESKYGDIPLSYSDENEYPIVVFKKDGTFVGGYKTLAEAVKAAGLISGSGSLVGGEDAVIYFRTDFTHSAGSGHVAEFYNDVTIDLGGHTITVTVSFLGMYFDGTLAGDATFGTITIKNGTFISNHNNTSYSILRLDSASGATHVTYNVNFDNVTIGTSNTKFVAISTAKNSTGTVNSEFTNCVFDYTNAPAKSYMFASGNAGKINATVIGCEIRGGANSIGFISTSDNTRALAYYPDIKDDVLTIKKDANGAYVKLTLNSGAAAPAASNVWKTSEGVECVFVKKSENDTTATYVMYPKALVGYNIKTSVTLYTNFVYNIYIPEADFVSAILDGEAANAALVTIDGANYYHIEVSLPIAESLKDIKLTVTKKSGDTTVNANWTLNVISYAASVLADTNADAVTVAAQALVKDMLVYAKTAYTHFEQVYLTDANSAKLTEVLGGYAGADVADLDNKVVNTTSDKYFDRIEISLDEVPSFRFYLKNAADADKFTFTVGGKATDVTVVNGSDGNALYIEVTMYAYMMLDTVSYTVNENGEAVTESYNLYSYYKFVSGLTEEYYDADLIALVKGLINYSASAADYKTSVIGNGN